MKLNLVSASALLYSTVSFMAGAQTAPHMNLVGVNLAGPAFSADGVVPGVVGTNYVYPTHDEIDYFSAKGLNIFRLSFLIERLEHDQNGSFDADELARIDDIVNYSATKGIKVILDPHNGGVAWGNDIGTSGTPTSSLTNFNGTLAAHYANTPNVIFGIMNEPRQSAAVWEPIAQDSLNAIRAAGATSQEIFVPGAYGQNATDWANSDNAAVMGRIQDPNHNMAFELHVYFDATSGGIAAAAVSATIGVERITAATKWAEVSGNRLFLGEFGASQEPTSLLALGNMLTYMDQHTGAWQGGTEWAAGPWWGNDIYSVEPTGGPGNYVDKPQIGLLTQHLPATGTAPASNPTPMATAISPSAWYVVANQNSQECIDAQGWGKANGTVVEQWNCLKGQGNQQWQFQPTDSGYYTVVSRNAPSEVLDVAEAVTANGGQIHLWNYVGGSNQQWMPVASRTGFTLVGRGSGRCLDTPSASTDIGVQLQIYDCNGSQA